MEHLYSPCGSTQWWARSDAHQQLADLAAERGLLVRVADDHEADLALGDHAPVDGNDAGVRLVGPELVTVEVDLADVGGARLEVPGVPVGPSTDALGHDGGVGRAVVARVLFDDDVASVGHGGHVVGVVALHAGLGGRFGERVGDLPGLVVGGLVAGVGVAVQDLLGREHSLVGAIPRAEVLHVEEAGADEGLLQLEGKATVDLGQLGFELAGILAPPDAEARDADRHLEVEGVLVLIRIADVVLVAEELGLGNGDTQRPGEQQEKVLVVHVAGVGEASLVRADVVGFVAEEEDVEIVIGVVVGDGEVLVPDDLIGDRQADALVVIHGPLPLGPEPGSELDQITRVRRGVGAHGVEAEPGESRELVGVGTSHHVMVDQAAGVGGVVGSRSLAGRGLAHRVLHIVVDESRFLMVVHLDSQVAG